MIVLFSWLDCGAGPSRTSSFAGLRRTENGCGAFQGLHCHFFILILVICFWKEEIDWSTVDVWDDVRHLDCSSLPLTFVFRQFSAEANAVETIRYLRRSSGFQPSDTWRPLLDEAFAKVATNSVSWSD